MLKLEDLKKLDVGDIAAYERYVKDLRRKELIDITKELYGDNIPTDAVFEIDKELKKIPSLYSEEGAEIGIDGIQFLLWRAMLKTDPDAKFEDAASLIDIENVDAFKDHILPQPDSLPPQKKTVKKTVTKKPRKKKLKDN